MTKKFTFHSARKTTVSKLKKANILRSDIVKFTGSDNTTTVAPLARRWQRRKKTNCLLLFREFKSQKFLHESNRDEVSKTDNDEHLKQLPNVYLKDTNNFSQTSCLVHLKIAINWSTYDEVVIGGKLLLLGIEVFPSLMLFDLCILNYQWFVSFAVCHIKLARLQLLS